MVDPDLEEQVHSKSTSREASQDPDQSATGFRSHLERFNYLGAAADEKTSDKKILMASRPVTRTIRNATAKRSSSISSPTRETTVSTQSSQSDAKARETPRSSSRKRRLNEPSTPPSQSPTGAKRRTTTKERSALDPYNPANNLVDSLDDNLMLVFIGLNPGLQTAATGHAYAHPSNFFWKLLYSSGITPIKHAAKDTYDMVKLYRIGNTNLCSRPTRAGDGLTQAEQEEGVGIIESKVVRYKPEAVCIVGKGIWETIYKAKTGTRLKKEAFQWGWQDESLWLGRQVDEKSEVTWRGAKTFVTTSTSGLAASLTPDEKLAVWKPLGDWIIARRAEKATEVEGVKMKPEVQ